MLTKYAKENGFSNTHFYVDDGITGTRFDRPGFQAMLDDIEMGYLSTVIVKDLSRLGRDYVTVGQYTDIYFPDHNVRFIAINDLVDSDEGENEIAPMAYWQSKGLPRGGKKTQPNPYKWCKTTVSKILAQQEYCGDIINFKTCSKSFKSKARYANSEDKWAIFQKCPRTDR